MWKETEKALRACEARAVRRRKTLTPRFTDFVTDFEAKTDCFAVLLNKTLFTWSRGPRFSGVGFFCFVYPRA